MPTMLCRSCGKIIPLAPVECPQCGTRQDRAPVAAGVKMGAAHVAGALLFGLISGLAVGIYAAKLPGGPSEPRPAAPPYPPGVRYVAPEPAPEPVVRPAPSPGHVPGVVNYQITFVKGSPELTPDGEAILGRVADTMHYYPLDDLNVIGYAGTSENDAQNLATARAFLVKAILSDRHGVKKERIRTQTKVTDREAYKVEVYIVAEGAQSVGSAQ